LLVWWLGKNNKTPQNGCFSMVIYHGRMGRKINNYQNTQKVIGGEKQNLTLSSLNDFCPLKGFLILCKKA